MILQDNTRCRITEEDVSELKPFNLRLSDLSSSNKPIFILSSHSDSIKNAINNKEYIVSIEQEDNSWFASTGNIVGFIGKGNKKLTITSRFCKTSPSSCDYFLHYLLSKVFAFNLNQLNSSVKDNYFLNLLFCLFPKFLNDALLQGIYKKYQVKNFNDNKFRGTVQLSKYLNRNIPNNGKISYQYSELSFDNEITQLIRHTIEYLKTKHLGRVLLNQSYVTRNNVFAIINATPSYKLQDRIKIIKNNGKIHFHPYYTNYFVLQKLCRAILLNENIIYSESDNSFYGLLIDMSWLWEEYIATLLTKLDFKHPINLSGCGGVRFGAKIEGESYEDNNSIFSFLSIKRFPDFYWGLNTDRTIIIDAKYKNYIDSDRSLDRNDVNQMLAYLYGMKGKFAVILCPGYSKNNFGYALSGWGRENNARLIVKNIELKDFFRDLQDCITFMHNSENKFVSFVKKLQFTISM